MVELKVANRHAVLVFLAGLIAMLPAGCNPAQQTNAREAAGSVTPSASTQFQDVAKAMLGPNAEVIAQGDLARNGLEQLLVINRFEKPAPVNAGAGDPPPILITRAVVIEKIAQKWIEVLRCDEHLKNPRGYLGGTPETPVTDWFLRFKMDTRQGLVLLLTPVDTNSRQAENLPVTVRWNTKTKRYQSLDRSQEEFLDEAPALEPARSILR